LRRDVGGYRRIVANGAVVALGLNFRGMCVMLATASSMRMAMVVLNSMNG